MRNFLKFLLRYYAFFLFLALEVVCLILYFRSAEYPNASVVYSANRLAGNAYSRYASLVEYTRLDDRNDSLAAENARLREQLANARMIDSVHERCVDDSMYRQLYTYIPARVIKSSITARNNYLTLDRGSREGIRPDMGVITDDGIVGKVVAVSEHFSVVMSVLHSKFSSSAALRPTGAIKVSDRVAASLAEDSMRQGAGLNATGAGTGVAAGQGSLRPELPSISGRLSWDGKNPARVQLIDIPGHVQPRPGDAVFTTGFGTLFPEGIPVGRVEAVRQAAGSFFLEIDVALGPDFSGLRHAYVVNYLQKEEREALETEAEEE
jgi:rod shape-determining protein MreC